MTTKPVKLLCVGDVNGKFQDLLKRLKLVTQKSGAVDILLCVGEFFGPDSGQISLIYIENFIYFHFRRE